MFSWAILHEGKKTEKFCTVARAYQKAVWTDHKIAKHATNCSFFYTSTLWLCAFSSPKGKKPSKMHFWPFCEVRIHWRLRLVWMGGQRCWKNFFLKKCGKEHGKMEKFWDLKINHPQRQKRWRGFIIVQSHQHKRCCPTEMVEGSRLPHLRGSDQNIYIHPPRVALALGQ